MIEIATGRFPYTLWATPFDQLKQVVMEDAPKLPPNQFSPNFEDFISKCLVKTVTSRASYSELLEHPFLANLPDQADMAAFVADILDLPS